MPRCRFLVLVVLVSVGLLGAARSASAQLPPSEPLLECHSSARAPYLCDAVGGCDRDLKLGRIRMDGAFRCYSRWLDCDLLARAGSSAADTCPARAASRCVREQSIQNAYVTGSAPDQRQRVLDRCIPIDFDDAFMAGAPLGLGMEANASTCGTLGLPLGTVEDYVTCGDVRETQLHAEVLSLIAPRTRELLEASGWCVLFPNEDGADPDQCNDGLATTTTGPGAPAAAVNHMRRCQRKLYRSYRQLLNRHLNLLEHCTEEFLGCNLRDAHGDITATALPGCLQRAENTCERLVGRRDRKLPRLLEGIRKSCSNLTFEDMTDMLGYAGVAAGCNATTTDELITCAADQLRCLSWDIVRFAEPRISDDTPAGYLDSYQSCGN